MEIQNDDCNIQDSLFFEKIQSISPTPAPTPTAPISVTSTSTSTAIPEVEADAEAEIADLDDEVDIEPAPIPIPAFPIDPEEIEWMQSAKQGDMDALMKVWGKYAENIFRSAMKYLKCREEAEQVQQDIFIKFYENIKSIRTEHSPAPWFYKITKNHCINIINRANRHPIYLIGSISTDEPYDENHNHESIIYFETADQNKPSPLNAAIASEYHQYLTRAIERLKPDFREIILMKYQYYMSYSKIARKLNIPMGTVMSRLFNAKQSLEIIFKHLIKER